MDVAVARQATGRGLCFRRGVCSCGLLQDCGEKIREHSRMNFTWQRSPSGIWQPLCIAFIGLENAGIVVANSSTMISLGNVHARTRSGAVWQSAGYATPENLANSRRHMLIGHHAAPRSADGRSGLSIGVHALWPPRRSPRPPSNSICAGPYTSDYSKSSLSFLRRPFRQPRNIGGGDQEGQADAKTIMRFSVSTLFY